ncbi:MAG: SAM-dependent methyltransferase [Clostridia bacterium]|nr:SAM-dependent methyltransferase [Clostridia bacterium]
MLLQGELGRRLSAAADYVRAGAVFADIGTDHAFLPIFLAGEGKISRAYACDVAEKPVQLAKENIKEAGLGDIIEARLTNGFCGLSELGITDAAVCGMGAELICELLSDKSAEFLKTDRIRLILQPMSRAPFLREYLADNGFAVVDEKIVRDADRQYEIICAEYTGEKYTLTELEIQLGKKNIERGGSELKILASRRALHFSNLLGGKSGEEREKTQRLLDMLKDISEV